MRRAPPSARSPRVRFGSPWRTAVISAWCGAGAARTRSAASSARRSGGADRFHRVVGRASAPPGVAVEERAGLLQIGGMEVAWAEIGAAPERDVHQVDR